MKRLIVVHRYGFCALLTWLLLVSCSGDPQVFEEAAEADRLDLAALSVVPPADSLTPLYVSRGQQLTFTLSGRNSTTDVVELTSTGRRWSVSRSAVASINSDGLLTAKAAGTTNVKVEIGGIVSDEFEVTVSDAAFQSIDRLNGELTVDRCVPQRYTVVGVFENEADFPRTLPDVEWSILGGTGASIDANADGGAELNAQSVGAVTLRAEAMGQTLDSMVMVADTLRSISILPGTLAVQVGATQQLQAQGLYVSADDTETTRNITAGVDWSITTGNDFVTVGNTDNDKGLLRGRAGGAANVTASCGNVQEPRDLVVTASSSSNELSFEQGSRLNLSNDGRSRQLKVSTGSSYESDDDVTEDAEWTILNGITTVISLSNLSGSKGQITSVGLGEVTVQATFNNRSASIVINVSQ